MRAGRLTRFAILTGATLLSACSASHSGDAGPEEEDAGTIVAPYGTPSIQIV